MFALVCLSFGEKAFSGNFSKKGYRFFVFCPFELATATNFAGKIGNFHHEFIQILVVRWLDSPCPQQ
jgi:hypothetical protein